MFTTFLSPEEERKTFINTRMIQEAAVTGSRTPELQYDPEGPTSYLDCLELG